MNTNHVISFYEKTLNFLILQKKEQESRRFVLECNLNRKGYYFDNEYLKSEISKCRANEDYLNFTIKILKENYTDLLKKTKEINCYEQVTIS